MPGGLPGADPQAAFHINIHVTAQDTDVVLAGARLTLLSALTLDTLATDLYTDDAGSYAGTIRIDAASISEQSYWMEAPFPNPVAAGQEQVTIPYTLFREQERPPHLDLYDALGRAVNAESHLAAGVYWYRLRWSAGRVTRAQSLVLLRGGPVRFELTPRAPALLLDASGRLRGKGEITTSALLLVEKEGYAPREEHLPLTFGRDSAARVALVNQNEGTAHRAQVVSPNGQVVFDVNLRDADHRPACLFYRVSHGGRPVVLDSEISLHLRRQQPLRCHWQIVGVSRHEEDRVWQPIYGERNTLPDRYNGLMLELEETADERRRLRLEIRAYDEGVAFRYGFAEEARQDPWTITEERTELHFPEGTTGYAQYVIEGPYQRVPVEDIEPGCVHPLAIEYPDGRVASFTEAAVIDYARMALAPRKDRPGALVSTLFSTVEIEAFPFWTPWRVFLVGDDPGDLVEHNYVLKNLNSSHALQETAWIKPGKAMRVMNGTTRSAKNVIDFAVQHNIAYISLSTGWYGDEYDERSDATTPAPLLDMPAVIDYAAARDVGIFLYVNRLALERQLDQLLPLYERWGIKGVKFGFVRNQEQSWSRWLHEAVDKAARHHLLLNIHDSYRPTGVSRTYPNLLTQEGIRGSEHVPTAEHNVTLPFTRFVAGAADYAISYYDSRLQTSFAHQLAMAVVYYSPLQFIFWYDYPALYRGEPEIAFWDHVPTVWDDTRVVHGRIGDFVTVARRSGDTWFVGSLTDEQGRTLDLSLDFLEPGRRYEAHIFADDLDAEARRAPVRIERRLVESTTTLSLVLAPRGGQGIRLVPVAEAEVEDAAQ